MPFSPLFWGRVPLFYYSKLGKQCYPYSNLSTGGPSLSPVAQFNRFKLGAKWRSFFFSTHSKGNHEGMGELFRPASLRPVKRVQRRRQLAKIILLVKARLFSCGVLHTKQGKPIFCFKRGIKKLALVFVGAICSLLLFVFGSESSIEGLPKTTFARSPRSALLPLFWGRVPVLT